MTAAPSRLREHEGRRLPVSRPESPGSPARNHATTGGAAPDCRRLSPTLERATHRCGVEKRSSRQAHNLESAGSNPAPATSSVPIARDSIVPAAGVELMRQALSHPQQNSLTVWRDSWQAVVMRTLETAGLAREVTSSPAAITFAITPDGVRALAQEV